MPDIEAPGAETTNTDSIPAVSSRRARTDGERATDGKDTARAPGDARRPTENGDTHQVHTGTNGGTAAKDASGRDAGSKNAGGAEAGGAKAGSKQNDGRRSATRSSHDSRDLHSGHKLAKRYRLEECITRLDGFSSWRAVDEKLRRAVGVHVLPDDHPRASAVLRAARAAALLADPRFVRVLDADRHGGLVHVIHEWLPDSSPLSSLIQAGAFDPHEAYDLVQQVAQGMAAAHDKGLAHLRLTPGTVLRTAAGQFRIRGLAVDAALRGITAESPKRVDTEAIGALLYAALTQRWPYTEGAYGLRGVPGLSRGSRESLSAPEQVRAGVHRGLSDLAMRALINDGATAASQQTPCTSPRELVEVLAEVSPPPKPAEELLAGFQRTTFQQGTYGAPAATRLPPTPTSAPPALPGRTGTALKWSVSALLILALGLGSWQVADALIEGDTTAETPRPTPSTDAPTTGAAKDPGEPLPVAGIHDFDPYDATNGEENPDETAWAIDDDPESAWSTMNYFGAGFGNLKPGVGLLLDLGELQTVSSMQVNTIGGDHAVELRVAPPSTMGLPASLDTFTVLDQATGSSLDLQTEDPVETQYVLLWLTDVPQGNDGNYRGRISDITVNS